MEGKIASKYDFIKVRVFLTDGDTKERRSYVLSRFLTTRLLTAIQVPEKKALMASLQLKKRLVDGGLLELEQGALEEQLFGVLADLSFSGALLAEKFRRLQHFFQERRPLLIVLHGPPRLFKTSLASQLAARLPLSAVVQADLLEPVLARCCPGEGPGDVLLSPGALDRAQVLEGYRGKCRAVCGALRGDVSKCLREGKSTVMEGVFLTPGLLLEGAGGAGPASPGQRAIVVSARVAVQDPEEHEHMLQGWWLEEAERRRRAGEGTCGLDVLRQRLAWIEEEHAAPASASPSPPDRPALTIPVASTTLAQALDRLHEVALDAILGAGASEGGEAGRRAPEPAT